MKKATLWSLVVVLALAAYLIFTLLFTWLFQVAPPPKAANTPTPKPTFTPTSTATTLVIAAVTPATPTSLPSPTPSPSAIPIPPPTNTPTATITPTPIMPQVVSETPVNVRSGPGLNYPVIGALRPGEKLEVIGRDEQAAWWQVQLAGGVVGWVSNSVVEASGVEGVPIAQAPPPPEPTATPIPPTPTRPPFQFEPTGWWGDTNYGLTRFWGNITDINGAPVNGVFVEAQCGSFRVISNPSGPVAGSIRGDSADDPPGFYDITLDRRPIPCQWYLTVVASEDGGRTVSAYLSDHVLVETTVDKSIVVANWRKNW
jgi:hypothetical protein